MSGLRGEPRVEAVSQSSRAGAGIQETLSRLRPGQIAATVAALSVGLYAIVLVLLSTPLGFWAHGVALWGHLAASLAGAIWLIVDINRFDQQTWIAAHRSKSAWTGWAVASIFALVIAVPLAAVYATGIRPQLQEARRTPS